MESWESEENSLGGRMIGTKGTSYCLSSSHLRGWVQIFFIELIGQFCSNNWIDFLLSAMHGIDVCRNWTLLITTVSRYFPHTNTGPRPRTRFWIHYLNVFWFDFPLFAGLYRAVRKRKGLEVVGVEHPSQQSVIIKVNDLRNAQPNRRRL